MGAGPAGVPVPVSWSAWLLGTRHLQRDDSRVALRFFRAVGYAMTADGDARKRWEKKESMNAGFFGEIIDDA